VVTRPRAEPELAEGAEDLGERPARPGLPVDPHRLLWALSASRRWLLAAALAGLAAGASVGALMLRDPYTAAAAVQYEGLPGHSALDLERELPSLVAPVASDRMMSALRRTLSVPGASLEAMRHVVHVEADARSGLLSFTGTGASPEQAARAANTLVTLFLEHHRERRQRELLAESAAVRTRLASAEADLEQARQTYDDFREAQGISDLNQEQEEAIAQAAELRSQAELSQAEIGALEARVAQLRGAVARAPRSTVVLDTSEGAGRALELVERLRAARSTLSDDHPTVLALERQVEAVERERPGALQRSTPSALHEQLSASLAEAEAELETVRRRRETLAELAGQAQDRTNRFSTIEGQAANLLARVNLAQARVADLRSESSSLDDQRRAVETGFRVIAEARPPEAPVSSKRRYVVAAAIPVLCLLLVAAAAVARELRGLRVKTATELAFWGGGPVVGATTWPRDPSALLDLIADMDDQAPNASGTMLVVAADETEQPLACEIAAQLDHDWGSSERIELALVELPARPAHPPEDSVLGSPHASAPHSMARIQELPPAQGRDAITARATRVVSATLALPPDLRDDPEAPLGGLALDDDATPRRPRLVCRAWSGPSDGQALRRAARLADRVLVVVLSGAMKATDLARCKMRLGRDDSVGYVLVDASGAVARLRDRVGPVEEFWKRHG
jgi:uncharacterized protein involved in exopolysaccharide biosynthesis